MKLLLAAAAACCCCCLFSRLCTELIYDFQRFAVALPPSNFSKDPACEHYFLSAMSSYSEGGFHGKGGIPIKGNPRRDADATGRPSSLVGSHDERCSAAPLSSHTKSLTLALQQLQPHRRSQAA